MAVHEAVLQALQRLDDGEALEGVLADYPQHTEAIRRAAVTLQRAQQGPAGPSQTARARSRRDFLARAALLRGDEDPIADDQRPAVVPVRRPARPDRGAWVGRVAAIMVAALALVALLVSAGGALPGDALYPVKRGVEQATLLVNPAAAAGLEAERLEEVRALIAANRSEQVTFTALITTVRSDVFTAGGVQVRYTPETTLSGPVSAWGEAEGYRARITGVTQRDGVEAAEVVILVGADDVQPTRTPFPQATPEPSPSPTPTLTLTPPAVPPVSTTAPPPPPTAASPETGDDDGESEDEHEQEDESEED